MAPYLPDWRQSGGVQWKNTMHTVYVLRSSVGKSYTGMTNNLARRIYEHNAGHTKSTRNQQWEVVYSEELPNRLGARKREKYLKSAAGRRYLQSIMKK